MATEGEAAGGRTVEVATRLTCRLLFSFARVPDFAAAAAEEAKAAGDDPHAFELARLAYELKERKSLAAEQAARAELVGSKRSAVASRAELVEGIEGHVSSIEQATVPLQRELGLTLTRRVRTHNEASALPGPLRAGESLATLSLSLSLSLSLFCIFLSYLFFISRSRSLCMCVCVCVCVCVRARVCSSLRAP